MRLPPYNCEKAVALIKERPGAPYVAFEVAARAYRRSQLGDHDAAALLFCLAADRADAEHRAAPSRPNQTMNHIVRAGIAFNRAQALETSEPLLRQAIDFDWAGQGLLNDQHMVEWAFYLLLLNARNEPERFERLFEEAVLRCAEIGRDYTMIRPHQERLLGIALDLELRTIVERLTGKIARWRTARKATRAVLARGRSFLAAS